jgi:hypothetical protein
MKNNCYFECEEEAPNDEMESIGLTGLIFLSVPVLVIVLLAVLIF